MNYSILAAFGVGLILIFIIGKTMLVPFKLIVKLFINAAIGGIALLVINYFGNYFNLHIPVNPVTALVAGFLGLPGIVLLLVAQYIILK